MERDKARSYIEKRVQNARTEVTDDHAASGVSLDGDIPVESAQFHAQNGFIAYTASYLNLDSNLPIDKRGTILAKAYAKEAERSAKFATKYSALPRAQERFQRLTRKSERIAQGLTRASKRA